MLTSIINRILNTLPLTFIRRNQFEITADFQAETVNSEIIQIEPPKPEPKPVVGIFVDLDNVIGQLSDYKTKQAVLNNIDLFFIHMAKRYEGEVYVHVYGNLSCWKLKETLFELENISVKYIDTPVVNKYDKTTTDHKMVVDMMKPGRNLSQGVLVTCDAGFMHVAEFYQEQGTPVELVQFGPTNYLLKLVVNTIVSGFDILKEANIINSEHLVPTFNSHKPVGFSGYKRKKTPYKYADEMLIEAIESSNGEYVLAEASQLLKEFKTDDWRGYKTFTQFVESLNIPNLKIDKERHGLLSIDEHTSVESSVERKLSSMQVPVLNAKQYGSIFNTLATCALDKDPSQLIDTVYEQCKKSECAVTRQELEEVIVKVLPGIKKSNKPYVLASNYLKWLFQKSKVSFKGILNSHDRENLTLLIQG